MFRFCALLLFLPLLLAGCPGEFTQEACVTLDSPTSRIFIRDYQFDRFRFFDIGCIGDSNYLAPGDSLYAFWLFQSIGTLDPEQPEAVAYPNALDPQSSPDSVSQRFRQLDFGDDFELVSDPREGRHYIFFPERLQNVATTMLAYHMVVKRADHSLLTFGDLSGNPLRLQILKRSNPRPSDPHWNSEWKNVYDLGARNIDYLELNLDVFKGPIDDEFNWMNLNHQNGVYYLRLLRLDRVNIVGIPPPDNRVDDDPKMLDTTRGLLIFPSREPFADSAVLVDPSLILYRIADENELAEASKYYIRFGYPFELGHRDIVKGSVTVHADGVAIPDGHFRVQNSEGRIMFNRIADSMLANSEVLQVCFEYWK